MKFCRWKKLHIISVLCTSIATDYMKLVTILKYRPAHPPIPTPHSVVQDKLPCLPPFFRTVTTSDQFSPSTTQIVQWQASPETRRVITSSASLRKRLRDCAVAHERCADSFARTEIRIYLLIYYDIEQ